MTFTLRDPALPSFARWRNMTRLAPGESVLRALEYETLDGLDLTGNLLDFGGGQTAYYSRWLRNADVSSVNIDAQFNPTHLVPPGDPLPFADATFDTVVTFNTLEHIYDDVGALRELARVTRPGGGLHVMVPFLFRVHGHPDDYNRHTPSWWGQTLADLGYGQVDLTPLIFGRRTTAQLIAGRGGRVIRPLTGAIAATRDILAAKLSHPGQTHYTGRKGEKTWVQAPGWYIHATK